MLLLATLALYCIFRLGEFGWSVYRAERWSQALWQQVQRGPGAVVNLAQLGPSDWDRVYIICPYNTPEMIQQILGFPWPDAEWTHVALNEGVNLVVFLRAGKVVGWFEHPRNRGELGSLANLVGYARDEARFVVALAPDQRPVLVGQ